MTTATLITVHTTINAPVEKAWESFTSPKHIMQWNAASDDWHCPSSSVDLREGGAFTCRMEAKDKSFGFDFGGIYDEIITNELITYTLEDGRRVKITFEPQGNQTLVTELFEPENHNALDLQRGGWQAILDNYKKHTEMF